MNAFTPLRDAVPPGELRRVLVIKLRHHGDVLTASPVFSTLKAHAPAARIDALVYRDTQDMLSLHPAIDTVHTIDRQWKKLGPLGQLRAEAGLFSTLRAQRYDLIVHLTEHWRGAWLCRLLKPRWSVGPRMPGRGKRWTRSFTHLQEMPRHALRHMVDTNLDALRRLGMHPTPASQRMQLVPGPAAEASVDAHLAALGVAPGQFIHLHPTSRWLFKCWPAEQMAELINRLHAMGRTVVLTAAPSAFEQAMLGAIEARLARPALSLAGRLNLKELAALTARAGLFVGVDSAPMHIAAAVGTPLVTLFGPSGDKQWGPWGVPAEVLTSNHSCRPCGIDGCGGGKLSDCLRVITVDQVLAAIARLENGTGRA